MDRGASDDAELIPGDWYNTLLAIVRLLSYDIIPFLK